MDVTNLKFGTSFITPVSPLAITYMGQPYEAS